MITTLPALLKDVDEKMKKSVAAITRQFSEVRSGRANPALLEHLTVSYYGTSTPLKQLAAITAPEARLLVVQPWDSTLVPEIEKAILKSDLGMTPSQDGKLLRLPIPPLTSERRAELTKLVHKMAEEGRITVRTIRRDANEVLKKLKADKQITEDDVFDTQAQIQKVTDKFVEEINALVKTKEHDLLAA